MTDAVTSPAVKRIVVATDRSNTADAAAQWAAHLARSHGSELVLLRVLAASPSIGAVPPDGDLHADLQQFAAELAGDRGRGRVVVSDDPAQAIIDSAAEEGADVLVVGNVGMSGRREFLLGNIPNRISHGARCTVVIVNTATADGSGMRAATSPTAVEGMLLRRAWHIGRVMVRAGLPLLRKSARSGDAEVERAAARRFRDALDELGPTFAKLGQILSTRPDLIPPSFVEELATLQERVTPLTEAQVVAAMERELGVPWEDVFASIDPEPLAAGTIAQVHRATLEWGERVVVKVQRPTAEGDIAQDLALLDMFAERAARRPALRRTIDIPAVIAHLSSSLRRELDFREEASNLRRMAEVLAPFPRLGVPQVYDEYSTSRLLVMQDIQGGPVSEAPTGQSRTEAARQLLEAYYHQVMVAGFFHADPHPGNMKWWNERVYFLDLGMVGEVDSKVREAILLLLLAFSQRDAPFLTEVVMMLAATAGQAGGVDLPPLERDLNDLITRYRNLSLREIQLGPLLQEVGKLAVKHGVRLPASLVLIGKAFAQMQLAAGELDPTLDPFAVAESFVLRNTLRQMTERVDPRALFYEAQKARVRVNKVVEAFESALGARSGPHLQVDFGGTERLEGSIDRAGRRLSLAMGIAGSALVTAATAGDSRLPRWLPAVWGGIGGVLAAGLLLDRPRRR